VRTVVRAHEILTQRGEAVRLLIAGGPIRQPNSIPPQKSRAGPAMRE